MPPIKEGSFVVAKYLDRIEDIKNGQTYIIVTKEDGISYKRIFNVNTKKGNVVIISEDEYNSLTETLYLTSIPGMKDRLEEGIDATIDDCVDFEW